MGLVRRYCWWVERFLEPPVQASGVWAGNGAAATRVPEESSVTNLPARIVNSLIFNIR